MVERNGTLPINAARPTTLEGRDISQAFEHFPTSVREFLQQQDLMHAYRPVFELAQLGVEAAEGYWAEQRLQGEIRRDSLSAADEIPEDRRPTVIWLGGLMTWKGVGEAGQRFSALTPMAFKGPYAVDFEYLKARGAKVIPIFPESGVNTPDEIERNVLKAAQAIHVASESGDGPIELVGHSMGVGEEYLLAAEYPDAASKVDHYFQGGFSLPVWTNYWVEGTFAAFRRGKELKIPTEMIEFLTSRESMGTRSKMVSWVNNDDRILRGPSPDGVNLRSVNAGHSAIFYSKDVMDEMWQTISEDMRQRSV